MDVGALPYKPGGKQFLDDPEKMFGRESRSLKACYELIQASILAHSPQYFQIMDDPKEMFRQEFRSLKPTTS